MKQRQKKSNGITRHRLRLSVLLLAVVALILGGSAPELWARGGRHHRILETIPFAETAIFFEYNSTDQDLGLQIFFDAEGWKEVEVKNRDSEIFEVENGGGLSKVGSTEVFTESAEPPLCKEEDVEDCDEQDIEDAIREFQQKFPQGTYTFRGVTVDGKRLKGSAMLKHALPAAPEIEEPEEDGDPADIAFIDWESGAGGPTIVGWEVVAEMVANESGEERVYVNTATLPADITEFTVSTEFAELAEDLEGAGKLLELKVEVIAIAENGNKTITEVVVFELEVE